MDRETLAWAAGFYDGEGSTGLSRFSRAGKNGKPRKYWKRYPVMTIAQTGTGEELHRFRSSVLDLGKVRGPYGPYSGNKTSYYQWEVNGLEKVQAIASMLWGFLCSPKKKQIEKVLKEFNEQYEGEQS